MDKPKEHDGENGKLWGGRFSANTDSLMEKLNASIHVDKRMWAEDIIASQAYAKGLHKVDLLTIEENNSIYDGLKKVYSEWESGEFTLLSSDEDIHTANERRLVEVIGDVGKKLHTGRSRNDQVATDTRMWLRKHIEQILSSLRSLISCFLKRAEDEMDLLMPGYTHMQRAQPIRWSHWLMSHAWFLKNDVDRLVQLSYRVNQLPLGSGAIAGNPFGVDREYLAEELSFSGVIENSMVGCSDRDMVAEFMFWCSLTMTHLSKWAEDLIIYNSKEFQFVRLSDAYCTGSSLMPQKKNPDSLELIRGKCGRMFGNMSGFMMTLKGLPSTYNKDLQEDKEPLFDCVDTVINVLQVSAGTLKTLSVSKDNCLRALTPDMLATDVAYYLVRKGVPFREAHRLSGEVVTLAESKDVRVNELSLEDMYSISNHFTSDVENIWDYNASTEQYSSTGGTSKTSVANQIMNMRKWLSQ